MKRNLAFLLIMTSATLAQTPAVAVKPVAKPSAASVKVAPQTGAKAQPSTAKVSAAPAPKPATASVQVAPAKPAVAASVKPSAVAGPVVKAATTTPKSASTPAVIAAKPVPEPAKVAVGNAKVPQAPGKKVAEVKVPVKEAPKAVAVKVPAKQLPAVEAKGSIKAHTTVAVQDTKANEGDKKPAPKTINAVGRRDPFVSPVVKLGAIGSGCSSGKRCLAIEQIALKGVVRSDVGMIAVVVNAAAKAYFLRENDPVFNGYVVKITGDSIVFKESFKDRLGKPLTRDVTKSISRPAV